MTTISTVDQLLANNTIISDQIQKPALAVVLRHMAQVIHNGVAGDIVECGCYIGTTTLFMRRLLDTLAPAGNQLLYAYDSFAGLPAKDAKDASGTGEQFQAGALAVSKKEFLNQFHKAHLKPPVTVKAWFADLQPKDFPETICFAFLDGDFYGSIVDSLRLVWPKLSIGGIIAIDDYQRSALPGVERAVQDFFQNKPISLHHEQHIAIISRLA